AETERRQSETHSDWIRQLFAQLPMQLAYFSPPPDVRCLFANSLYAQALGHDEHSILGRSIGELLTPDELDHLRLASRPFVESGQDLSFLHPRQRLDGEEMLEVSIAADRTPDGRLRGSFALITDVTERHRAELALLASRERLSRFLEASA